MLVKFECISNYTELFELWHLLWPQTTLCSLTYSYKAFHSDYMQFLLHLGCSKVQELDPKPCCKKMTKEDVNIPAFSYHLS